MKKTLPLKKSRQVLHSGYSLFKKKGAQLSDSARAKMEHDLKALENSLFDRDKEKASSLALSIEEMMNRHFPKPFWRMAMEIGVAVLFALLIATLVRQMWFELYEIPTGSMRPSFREQDRLTVTKTPFGLNVPLKTEHFYFDPSLVERGKVFIFSGENIRTLDETTNYLYLFPSLKRYIKRMIAKPGDTLYFYGGKIYGIDKEGKPLNELLDDSWMKQLEHIPFIHFEQDIAVPKENVFIVSFFNKPLGKLTVNPYGRPKGEILRKGRYVEENFQKNAQELGPRTLSDFWGIGNFAMARLLSREELVPLTSVDPATLPSAPLYLQLKHTPTLGLKNPAVFFTGWGMQARLATMETVIPLEARHVEAIANHMYTARFVVKNGKAARYSVNNHSLKESNPHFSDVPDGTYEIFKGKAEKIGFLGWSEQLEETHPLNQHTLLRTKNLFNAGIDSWSFDPKLHPDYYPHRYAYWKDGELYLLGAPIFKKEDPILEQFVENENKREQAASAASFYKAFVDRGPPLKEGALDVEFIKKFGLEVPEKSYVALGDNHAMSQDSRIVGFIPEDNIQGAPSYLIWPPGARWGNAPQTPYPMITLPRLIVWAAVGTLLLLWWIYRRHVHTKRLFPH